MFCWTNPESIQIRLFIIAVIRWMWKAFLPDHQRRGWCHEVVNGFCGAIVGNAESSFDCSLRIIITMILITEIAG